MKHHNTVLHQDDYRTGSLSCWDQMVALLFGQLSGSQSLRDLASGYNSKSAHHYRLGTGSIRRSSLAEASSKRPV